MPTLKPFKGDHYLWTYVPNLPAAVVFAIVFAALAIAHGWKTVKTKSWYCIAFVVGGCCASQIATRISLIETSKFRWLIELINIGEVIGYLARIGAYEATNSLVSFLLQGVFLVVAPVFFAASLYMVYARIVRAVHGEAFPPISPRMTTVLFVVGDLTCLNIQSSGAGLLGNEKIAYIGNDIVVVGLFLQVALFIGFIATGIVFHKRFRAQTAKANDFCRRRSLAIALVHALFNVRIDPGAQHLSGCRVFGRTTRICP